MSSPSSHGLGSAAERLLDAAVAVFAREGIHGATTREIAKEAGVNEVTLFRNFQTKQGLLAAVLERAFVPTEEVDVSVESGCSLEEAVRKFAEADFERKSENIALMRVLVGAAHRLGEHETAVFARIFRPWKEKLAQRLLDEQRLGKVRKGVNPVIVVDQLSALMFVGALRGEQCEVDYSPECYLDACVDVILRGIFGKYGEEFAGE